MLGDEKGAPVVLDHMAKIPHVGEVEAVAIIEGKAVGEEGDVGGP